MSQEEKSSAKVKPIEILLVEDNESDVKITLRAFKKAQMQSNVHVAYDGQEALDYVYHQGNFTDKNEHPRPDLILLDLNLPKRNGFEVLEKLKSDEQYKTIPVVMLTSSKNDSDVVRSYGEGAASYIQKPVTYEEFVKVVEGFNFYWHIINKLPVR